MPSVSTHDICNTDVEPLKLYDMKNLPATIGILAILTTIYIFTGSPDSQLQAEGLNSNEILQADTVPRKMLDTVSPVKHSRKKDWKKKDSPWRKDSVK
jgi:hypothetical protein